MLNRKKAIIGAGGVAVALTMALAALGPTGAYFSDTAQGELTGTKGSIKITGYDGTGGDNLNLAFSNLMPGTPQTVSSRYVNTGHNAQDVWVVFNDDEALAALQSTDGEFHIASNNTEIFGSADLATVPEMIQVGSNVGPNGVGKVSFTFGYASTVTVQSEVGGGVWNPYDSTNGDASETAEDGLPYQLVATQVGQKPGE